MQGSQEALHPHGSCARMAASRAFLQVISQGWCLFEQAEASLKCDPPASLTLESVHSGHPMKVWGTHV